jgi:mannose-1-phosphate guanylyltransferase
MNIFKGPWSIVLAAGDGNRLKALTTTEAGDTIPKQFCSLNRPECLLQLALQRAACISSPETTCTVVAAHHRRWWRGPLQHVPTSNVFIQPRNRGTAVGTALSLLHVETRDPDAIAVLLPADHFVRNEARLAEGLHELAHRASQDPSAVFLLGAEPDSADTELGYIVPYERTNGAQQVKEFVEKPSGAQARALIAAGALWNMFIVAGSVSLLLDLFDRSFNFVKPMRSALAQPVGALSRLYGELPVVDFSRDVLAHCPELLRVVTVPPCGWSDLGTPQRVAATVRETLRNGRNTDAGGAAMYFDLARAAGLG